MMSNAVPRSKGVNLRCKPEMINRAAQRIRGNLVSDAIVRLTSQQDKASRLLLRLLNEAIANAEHNQGLDADSLFISTIAVDESFTMKRIRARARGRADRFFKRSCNISLTLEEKGK